MCVVQCFISVEGLHMWLIFFFHFVLGVKCGSFQSSFGCHLVWILDVSFCLGVRVVEVTRKSPVFAEVVGGTTTGRLHGWLELGWCSSCCSIQLWAGQYGFQIMAGTRGFYFCRTAQTSSGSYPHSYSVGSRILTLGVKWPGHEVEHLPLSSAEVKSEWRYTSAPPIYTDRANFTRTLWYLVQHIRLHVWLCSITELRWKRCIYVYWEGACFCCT